MTSNKQDSSIPADRDQIELSIQKLDDELLGLLEHRWSLMKSLRHLDDDSPFQKTTTAGQTRGQLYDLFRKGSDLPLEVLVALLSEMETQIRKIPRY